MEMGVEIEIGIQIEIGMEIGIGKEIEIEIRIQIELIEIGKLLKSSNTVIKKMKKKMLEFCVEVENVRGIVSKLEK